jgi:hypothetical protein
MLGEERVFFGDILAFIKTFSLNWRKDQDAK